MGRNAQLIRQWAILKQIESTRWSTIPDMAVRHEVSTKTIRRDLAALMEAGFPLYDERYEGKVYWRLAEEYKGLPLANLSLSELAALYFSRNLVSALSAPPYSSDIDSAFKKIEGALPEKNIAFFNTLDSIIAVRADAPKDLEEHKQTIRTLMDAIGEDNRIRMEYYSVHSQRQKTYMVHPYRLMHFRGGLYLFGYVEEYEQIRTFAIERIVEVKKLADHFEKPADFSIESYLESAFGLVKEDPFDVEMLFKADIAQYVRSRAWHPSQKVRDVSDGEIVMNLHVGGEFELESWILSFGSSAVVLSPDRLRRKVTTDLARMLDNYRVEITVAPADGKKSKKKPRKAQAVKR